MSSKNVGMNSKGVGMGSEGVGMNRKVIITAPIRDREDIIDQYLDSIANLHYPKENLACVFLLNASTDGTKSRIVDRMRNAKSHKQSVLPKIMVAEMATPADILRDCRHVNVRPRLYEHLANIRNRIISIILDEKFMGPYADWDWQWVLDSDVMVDPESLSYLIEMAEKHKYDIFSATVENDYGFGASGNVLTLGLERDSFLSGDSLPNGIHYYLPTIPRGVPFDCYVTGACCLVNRRVLDYGIHYDVHPMGEDTLFCVSALLSGFRIGSVFCDFVEHRMYEKYRIIGRYEENADYKKQLGISVSHEAANIYV